MNIIKQSRIGIISKKKEWKGLKSIGMKDRTISGKRKEERKEKGLLIFWKW